MRFVFSLIAFAVVACVMPVMASAAGWSPVAPVSGWSGDRPNHLKALKLDAVGESGQEFRYWTRDVGGFETIQAMWVAANGTPGPIFNVSNPAADYGHDLQVVLAKDGEVTVAWIGPGAPNEVVRSVDIPLAGAPGPEVVRSPAGTAGQSIEHLSIAVGADGTVGYVWRRLNGLFWRVQGLTVPDNGPAGTVRYYSTFPDSIYDPEIAAFATTLGSPEVNFRIAWGTYNLTTKWYNIATIDAKNDGAFFTQLDPETGEDVQVPPTFLFATEREKLDSAGNPIPVPDKPGTFEKEPFGTTGYPHELNFESNPAGAAAYAWTQYTVVSHVDSTTGETIIDGSQWRAHTYSSAAPEKTPGGDLQSPGIFLGPIHAVTPLNVDISNIHMQINRDRRSTATWLANRNGTATNQVFRFSGPREVGGVWNLGPGPGFSDPNVSVARNGSMLVGWTREGLLPEDANAEFLRINRIGIASTPTITGLDALKTSYEPLPDAGELGLSSVLFVGVDQGNSSSFYKSSFTDPGIGILSDNVNFGRGLLGIRNRQGRVFITNPGTTPSQVTSVKLVGGEATNFGILNPTACIRKLDPSETCEVTMTFAPEELGVQQAKVAIESEAGDVSANLRGQAVPGTRVSLRVKPRNRRVRPGRKVTLRTVVKNTGGMKANGVRVCYDGNRFLLKPRKKCRRIGSLATGASRTVKLTTRIRRNARAGKQTVFVRMFAGNAVNRRAAVTLRVKRPR